MRYALEEDIGPTALQIDYVKTRKLSVSKMKTLGNQSQKKTKKIGRVKHQTDPLVTAGHSLVFRHSPRKKPVSQLTHIVSPDPVVVNYTRKAILHPYPKIALLHHHLNYHFFFFLGSSGGPPDY